MGNHTHFLQKVLIGSFSLFIFINFINMNFYRIDDENNAFLYFYQNMPEDLTLFYATTYILTLLREIQQT